MDTPFSAISYTNELILDRHARSVGDVLQNDPTVRVARGFGNFQESYFIRGFILDSDDTAYNGLYSLLPRQYIATELFERVEVLRGPYSALYGNSAGGVVSLFTETPEGRPFVEGGVSFGSDGQQRLSAKAGGQTAQGLSYVVSASRFMTDGWRDHSAADRNVANAKLSTALGDDARLTLVANTMASDAQDPQGLTWAQYQANPAPRLLQGRQRRCRGRKLQHPQIAAANPGGRHL